MNIIYSEFNVTEKQIKSICRIREIVDARRAIAYFLRKQHMVTNDLTAEVINKDRSVIAYMLRTYENLMNSNSEFKNKINKIKVALGLDKKICPCCGRAYDDK